MITAADANPINRKATIDMIINNICIHNPFTESPFLTFNENIGIGETSRADKTKTIAIMAIGEAVNTSNQSLYELLSPSITPTINMAFAGVGSPINEVVCWVSILKIANLSAEKTAIKNGTARITCPSIKP